MDNKKSYLRCFWGEGMKYTINKMVVYNSSDGTLLSIDDAIGMITLTRVTSELLLLLIKNNNSPISRDTILSELWDKKGLSSSNNNLNNYVSMLRKALAQCGCLDVITTVPKYGFIFKADVVLIAAMEKAQELNLVDDNNPQNELPYPVVSEKNRYLKQVTRQRTIKVTVLVLSLLLIMHSPWVYNYFRLKSIRTEIFSLEQCRFYLADDLTRSLPLVSTIKTIKKIVDNNDLNCNNETNVYFFAQKKRDSYGQVTMNGLLAYCSSNEKISCANYYLNKYEN
ncbi:Transcriptional regulatory protein%2C C terminal [Yersinia intermedia]|uniref:winged helix-turn-helix domain-containing protein n=2 Tax=Yersinia intermedia TaxID=631 RepID=UPI0005E82BDA|nr:winged helix-turn-helix domain-containing protein [Yersinia intermedia]CNC53291.1 Transcriptional regulatory protein%2C C terminal [Yersinia intermedia]CNG58924.1 Transcriptional regulatory protein%2C C terminal [Yersinia intermedia]